ncbi:MAG: hypothetical protein II363_02430 [Clostridia bacterium]|nr:hypothetical protein [Clostridia bacterium]
MQDNTPKGNVDLDKLVDTLLRERAQKTEKTGAGAAATQTPAEMFAAAMRAEGLLDAAVATEEEPTEAGDDIVFVEPEQAPSIEEVFETEEPEEEEIEQPVGMQEISDAASVLEEGEPQPVASPEKKRFRLFGKKRNKAQLEETPEEEWADWGLQPIGHYHVAEDADLTTPEEEPIPLTDQPDAPSKPEQVEAEALVEIETETEVETEAQTQTEEPVLAEEQPAAPPAEDDRIFEEPATQVDVSVPEEVAIASVTEVDEFPAVQAVEETIVLPVVTPTAVEQETRVIPIPSVEPSVPPIAPVVAESAVSEQLPNQLSLEEYLRVEDIEQADDFSDEQPEERLQRVRQEKIRDFTFSGEEEEENEPEEEVPEEADEEPIIEDFTGYEDTKAVSLELRYRCRTALLGALFTGLLELLLLLLTVSTALLGQSPITDIGFLTVELFGLGLMAVLNYPHVGRGLSGLFSLRANGDTGPALAVLFALGEVALHFLNMSKGLPFWAPVAGLLMLLQTICHYVQSVRIRQNFTFISYPGTKYTACLIEDEKALHEIGRRAVVDGDADVAYFRPSGFLSSYLTHAAEEDRGDDWMRWLAPLSLAASLLLSLVLLLTGHLTDLWSFTSCLVGMLCISMPAASLAVQLCLNQCSHTLLSRGGFLVGWKAVRQFGNPDALVVDVADLFPDESMLLHGIKTFGGAHIDDAILDAASLAVRAEGPLSMIFRRIIENKEELLREVDNLVYEQGMGLSGWVDDRRVLVGNRLLLQHHGVDVPSLDYEARYAKDGRRLVYLSTAGELSAMFVVTYAADDTIKSVLQDLCRAKVTLLVRSCDPNITAEDLCRDFELDDYYVDILPTAAGRLYMQLVTDEAESAPAVMASNGHILGTALALSVCRSLKIKSWIALLAQTIFALLGLGLCVAWILQGSFTFFLTVLGYILCASVTSWILPLFRRI